MKLYSMFDYWDGYDDETQTFTPEDIIITTESEFQVTADMIHPEDDEDEEHITWGEETIYPDDECMNFTDGIKPGDFCFSVNGCYQWYRKNQNEPSSSCDPYEGALIGTPQELINYIQEYWEDMYEFDSVKEMKRSKKQLINYLKTLPEYPEN